MSGTKSRRVRETLKICGIVVVTAIVVAMAIPTAVGAAGSLVTLVDSDGPSQAQVDDGSLRVRIGGKQVIARPQDPSGYVRGFGAAVGATCEKIIAPPAGKALVVTTLLVNVTSNPSPSPADWVAFYTGPNPCLSYVMHDVPATTGLRSLPLEPGITIPEGHSLWMLKNDEVTAYATAIGYSVAASAVPAEAPASANEDQDPLR